MSKKNNGALRDPISPVTFIAGSIRLLQMSIQMRFSEGHAQNFVWQKGRRRRGCHECSPPSHWESRQAQMRPRACWELVSWLSLLVETALYSWLWRKPIVLVSESRKRWISHPCCCCCCCWEQNPRDCKRSASSDVVVVCHKTCFLQTTLGWYYYTALLLIYYNSRLPSSLTKPLSPERAAP